MKQIIVSVIYVFMNKLNNREYFMESVGVRYLRTSCLRIRNRTSEISDTKTTSA